MANGLPRMHAVKSSNLAAVGYDAKAAELHVQFKNGAHYVYEGVPADLHGAMLRAESPGSFLSERVKGTFNFRKHDADAA